MNWHSCLFVGVSVVHMLISGCAQQFELDPNWHLTHEHFKLASARGVEADQWSAFEFVRSEAQFRYVLENEANKLLAKEHLAYRQVLKDWVSEQRVSQIEQWKKKKESLEVEVEVAQKLKQPVPFGVENDLSKINELLGSEQKCEEFTKFLREERTKKANAYREAYQARGKEHPESSADSEEQEPDLYAEYRLAMGSAPCITWYDLAREPASISHLDQMMLKHRVQERLAQSSKSTNQ